MKKEDLFEAIGKINAETIENNAPDWKMKKRMKSRTRWTAAAASLAVIAAVGVTSYYRWGMSEEFAGQERLDGDLSPASYDGKDMTEVLPTKKDDSKEHVKDEQKKAVDITSLMNNEENVAVKEERDRIARVKIDAYTAEYEGVEAASDEILAASLGKKLEGNEDWYRVFGHEDLQYLIQECKEEYLLWKFESFLEEDYPYRDVLEKIYKVTSPEDFCRVTVKAANMDNTDAGRKIQKEIGTYYVTDPADLQELYYILKGLNCYGSGHWDKVDYGDDTSLLQAVRLGRYLTIEIKGGMQIDDLKYTAVSGMFYEYDGLAYRRLSEQKRKTVEKILEIKSTSQEESPDQTTDAPVDENTYHESEGYPKEIEGIQKSISDAMGAGELPFVTESAIREDPLRIEVTVNTKDKELIKKVKAFDTVGGIVKVVYSDAAASFD